MDSITEKVVVEQLNSYALECKKAHKYTTAEIILNRAIEMYPKAGILWNNLGAVLWNLHRWDEAESALLKAKDLDYDIDTTSSNLGLLYSSQQRWDEAKYNLDRALELNPANKNPLWEKALCLLDKGDWEEGLRLYDVRREVKKEITPLKYPLWNGEDLNGKTIFIQGEQGFGDRILFHRYVYWLKDKWPEVKILYLCEPKLHNLFWELKLATGLEFVPDKVPWPEADYGQYLLNLPALHGTTVDNVYPDPGLIRKRVIPYKHTFTPPNPEDPDSIKVGICWTGNPIMDQNIQRSVPLDLLLSLAENPKVILYSLQLGEGERDVDRLDCNGLVCDLSSELKKEGWYGTALAVANMDLVITCCTSIAHLAGALEVPCWTMLCYAPYWVWLRNREDSVWYPKTKLYRQTVPGEWKDVINNIKHDLSALINKNKELKNGYS